MSVNLSVIIPAYNEEDVLAGTVQEVVDVFREEELEGEVIIVEDASTDETGTVASAAATHHDDVRTLENDWNMGKGGSVRRGMLAANGKLRLYMDADSSVRAHHIPLFVDKVEQGYDVVIGSRRHPDARVLDPQPLYRQICGRLGNALLIRPLLLPGFPDTQVGFKLFREECAMDVFEDLSASGWIFDAEILWLCENRGYRITALPVTWCDRGDSAVGLFDFLRSAVGVLRLFWRGQRPLSVPEGERPG